MIKFKEKNSGITLIALIITIIILIILAGITIGLLLNDDGIAGRATSTKTETEIGEEKEIVSLSSMDVVSKESIEDRERLNKDEVERIVEKNARGLNFEITEDDDGYIVEFTQKKRYYKIYDNGQTEQVELVKDKTPGDITKDKDGNTLNGTTNPYEIWSIEDLVAFAIMVNGGNSSLGIISDECSGKQVSLKRTLDFNSKISYNNYNTTIYGDLNKDGIIDDIKTELTKTEEGCIGFLGIGSGSKYFRGTFDGNDKWIKNLYMHKTSDGAGFFIDAGGTIKDLTITGEVINDSWHAGGINGSATTSRRTKINKLHKLCKCNRLQYCRRNDGIRK